MTSEDRVFPIDTFPQSDSIFLYRLARMRYANLSGIGSALFPGRWNRVGQEAIYTSTEMGVPLLERLVHTTKDLIPSNLALMTIRMTGQWKSSGQAPLMPTILGGRHASYLVDPEDMASISIFSTLRAARELLRKSFSRRSFCPIAAAVPSVVAPVWNVVLFPQGSSFGNHVKLEAVEPFEFDPRLFSEGATAEEAD